MPAIGNNIPASGNMLANGSTIITGRPSGKLNFNPTFFATGTFGGGTIKLQAGFIMSNGTTTYVDITGVTLAAAGYVAVPVRADSYQVVLSGATAPNLLWRFG